MFVLGLKLNHVSKRGLRALLLNNFLAVGVIKQFAPLRQHIVSFIVNCRLPIEHHVHNWRVPTATFEYDLINWIYRYVWKSGNVPGRDTNERRYLSWQLLNHCLCFVIFQDFPKTSKHKLPVEYVKWLKYRQTETPTTRNVDRSKTSKARNADGPKYRQTKTLINRNDNRLKPRLTRRHSKTFG